MRHLTVRYCNPSPQVTEHWNSDYNHTWDWTNTTSYLDLFTSSIKFGSVIHTYTTPMQTNSYKRSTNFQSMMLENMNIPRSKAQRPRLRCCYGCGNWLCISSHEQVCFRGYTGDQGESDRFLLRRKLSLFQNPVEKREKNKYKLEISDSSVQELKTPQRRTNRKR